MRPIITLTTDFGDGRFIAQLKGVLLTMCRDAVIVDIAHDLPAHDIDSTIYLLRDVVPAFPMSAIHLVVVDPGVGTSRRGLALRSGHAGAGGQYFVGPDNGLFTEFCEGATVHQLSEGGPRRAVVSAVFHGRDVFAPAAAHLANGLAMDALGPLIHDPVKRTLPKPRVSRHEVVGQVLFADRFGNITTNIEASQIPQAGEDGLRVEIGWAKLDRLSRTYGDVAIGEMVALIGSNGRLEVAVREGSAAQRLQLKELRGTPVRVVRGSPSMYGGVDPR
jgi:S-adenosylmethionine hydrolase